MKQLPLPPRHPAQTLVDLLIERGTGAAAQRGFTFFRGDEAEDQWLRYQELHRVSQDVACALWATDACSRWLDLLGTGGRCFHPSMASSQEAPPRVVILCPPGLSYLTALFGTLYSGAIAVTAYPPRARRNDPRLDRVIQDSGATIALADSTILQRREQILKSSPSLAELEWIDVDDLSLRQAKVWKNLTLDPDSLAILQYTSGSTSDPKGVCLTHRNLLANLRMIYEAFEVRTHDDNWSVTWLPPYHDMGLIGGLLQVMYAGVSSHVMPPAAFVQKPIRWLRAIDKYRATVSGGPNFAYDMCVQKIADADLQTLDLSRWTLAFTGAEPIRIDSLHRFAEKFQACGFARDAFYPCYGLAEATLMVSGGPRMRPIRTFEQTGNAGGLAAINRTALVSCGPVVPGERVRIVDPDSREPVEDGHVGEIWVAGDNVSPGYWNKPTESERVFAAQLHGEPRAFLRTGDLGFLQDDELFVSGRIKELIVIRGRNFHPMDLETIATQSSPHLLPNAAAAFEAFDEDDEVGLVIVLETERPESDEDADEAIRSVRQALIEAFELDPLRIVLIHKRSLPKTSSGKVQRLETKQLYLNGQLRTWRTSDDAVDSCGDRGSTKSKSVWNPLPTPCDETGKPPYGDSETTPRRSYQEIHRWLVERLARQMDLPADSIDAAKPFVHYGLDSVSAVQITSELETFLGRSIPATLFYEAPHIRAVAETLQTTETLQTEERVSQPLVASGTKERFQPELNSTHRWVAIIGMHCRLPGCHDPDDFWNLLRAGRVAVGDPPPSRRQCVSRQVITRRAGWIEDPDQFDAALFGIAPREAKCIDPQHRLLLETCWRAIENAGIDPKRLAGSRTGAFVGISNRDYERLIQRHRSERSTYVMTGNAASMAAHRLSFHLDLQGPSLAVDTACSSSLVALHQAVRALQSGDCDASIVAGVNLILSPEVSETLSVSEMLSADGLCKTFDATADGYVRGEGCVAMLLKPFDRALADGDPIRGVIRGVAINQDGQTNGITAPNGESQARLYRAALKDAGLMPQAITRLEAHGTGTPLGDPIEVRSLLEVYGEACDQPDETKYPSGPDSTRRSLSRCRLGAVKANVGHLEAAAGLSSLMKVVLELEHHQLAPQPNLSRLNPHIDLSQSRLEIPTHSVSWDASAPRIAAVSSFGFGGTNAHVIVSEPPAAETTSPTAEAVATGPQLVTLSARDASSLQQAAIEHADLLTTREVSLADFAAATQRQKTTHRYRLATVSDDRLALADRLRGDETKGERIHLHQGIAPADHPFAMAWLFSGQGGQFIGMGRGLYQRLNAFRNTVDDCDSLLEQEFGYQVGELLTSDPSTNGVVAERLAGPAAQTSLFVLQWALAKTLQDWGIHATTVLGHSMGEYAAAVVAGVMRWEDALRLTATRAQRIAELPVDGTMAVVFASVESVERELRGLDPRLCVAAIDAPDHVVVSGPSDAVRLLQHSLRQHAIESRPLRIAQAFHSSLIEPALDDVGALVRSFHLSLPNLTYISTLTGQAAAEELRTADYWIRHSRQPVQFVAALETLASQPCDVALEIGPHPTLCTLGRLNQRERIRFVPSLQRHRDDWRGLLEAVAELYVCGADPDWERLVQSATTDGECGDGSRRRRILLPGHPFHRERFWIDAAPSTEVHPNTGQTPAPFSTEVIERLQQERSKGTAPSDVTSDAASAAALQVAANALPEIDRLVAAWMRNGLASLGIGTRANEPIAVSLLIDEGRIAPQHRRLLTRICQILAEDGWLTADENASDPTGDRWRVVRPLSQERMSLEQSRRAIAERFPDVAHELEIAARCGQALPGVLSGEIEPLAVLFPDGDTASLERLYRESTVARCSNQLVADTARAIVEWQRQSRGETCGLRVLEIGAGTGGTTSFVLPAIADQITHYVFTDASPLLIADSLSRFGESVSYEVLDIEQPPAEQGFEPHSFDLVIAANVLHATRHLRQSLDHVLLLLREGGSLIALEGIRRERLLDLIFGLTEGWWRFDDPDLRPDYPLIDREQWLELLGQQGFADPVAVPYPTAVAAAADSQGVLLAHAGVDTDTAAALRLASTRGAGMVRPSVAANEASSLQPWIDAFHRGSAEKRHAAVEGYFRHSVAAILGFDPQRLDLDQPVSNLGIDSLMAIQLKNRLDKDLGISIPMVAFLQGKSVRQLIELAVAGKSSEQEDDAVQPRSDQYSPPATPLPQNEAGEVPALTSPAENKTASADSIETSAVEASSTDVSFPPRGDRILGPMSVGQLALWMIHQRAPHGPAYNFAFAARTNRSIDLAAMTRACQALVKRHPALRTRYRMQDKTAVRVLSDSIEVAIGEQDCRDWNEPQLLDWIRQEADRPFDLEHGPVIRFSLLRCRSGDVLAIAMHHIAADLWSMDVLIQELIDLYAMIVGGGSIELGTLPTTYDAYVAWEHDLDHSDEGERLWKFWREKLEGAPPVLALPTTYSRPPEQTFQGSSIEWTVPSEVVEGLRDVAHAERTTMFTIVLAAYQAFLSRVCNQDDLLVGTVSASRGRAEWEGIVGYFLNHLVLRTRILGSPSYREILRDTQREVLDALEHQAFPFAKLVEKIRPPRDASRSPLVQTMFIWDKPRNLKESHFAPGKSSDRLRLKPLLMEQRGAPFDLTLIVFELEDELKLTFRYNTDLFSDEAVQALAESLQLLIEAISNDPDLPVRSLPLLPPDQEGALAAWNATDTEFDATRSGDAWFRKWVRETPEAIALESSDQKLTYAQADRLISRVAHMLKRSGVIEGETVALLARRSVDAMVGILGIWRAGAAYVPLDPDHPVQRLQAICDDAAPRVLLASPDIDVSGELRLACPTLDLSDALHGESIVETDPPSTAATVSASPDSPAYLIYTSGSTGRPKGVVIPHRGVANLAMAQQQTFAIAAEDRCLQFASLNFDASVFEIMMAFHAGATLYVIDSAVVRSTTTEIADRIREAGVTVATLPPSVLAAIPADTLPQLRMVISAGEACSAALVAKWGVGREMFNAYGPTETTVWATTERCVLDGRDPSLGKPIANVRVHVVDANLERTPIGVPGELCISGPGLALEYRNLPAVTSNAFVPNPFDDHFDATMYRTGDRARWTHDGRLEFLGRVDDQLKIDGHRIEPDEIACVIRQFDSIQHAFVTAIEHAAGSQLVAYLIAGPVDCSMEQAATTLPGDSRTFHHADSHGGEPAKAVSDVELRRHLLARLPAYMVPRHFVWVDAFPLTINGKIDTSRLPRPGEVNQADEPLPIEPTTKTEAELREIWHEVLQREGVGIHDNFFDLGGASLQALQAADLAAKRGYRVSAETMFQFQTIAELAQQIDSRRESPDSQSTTSRGPITIAAAPTTALTSPVQPSNSISASKELKMVVESLGVYLPPGQLSTAEVVAGCKNRLDFPLQRMTGIESRRVVGEGEYSIDLARKAAQECLRHSRYSADQIDLLIACNISRYDGPDFQISYEPSTASLLKSQIGATSALAFDVCNACAGFFTALAIAQAELLAGQARRVMVVSGEYITHLTRTAQLELDGFLDPRLACLTLGDAGAAVMVELTDDGSGFETLDLYTAGSYHDLCIAKATDAPHGGAIMLTDAIKASAVTLDHSVSHAHRVLADHLWSPQDVQHLIMHQTSSTTLDGAVEELNRFFGQPVCGANNTINNLAHRGNTATTTHWVAVMDAIRSGRIHAGDKTVFAISGSGQTIGTALYRFDDLPERLGDRPADSIHDRERRPRREILVQPTTVHGVRIAAATVAAPAEGCDSERGCQWRVVDSAARAANACLESTGWDRNDVELLIHSGIYRDDFLSEPAVAAILAGELHLNHERPDSTGKKTLAFDLCDSGRSTMTALRIASNLIASGVISRALVTASEIENNAFDQPRRGVAEIGSAIALERTSHPELGLAGFSFRSYPRHAEALTASTLFRDGRPQLVVKQSEHLAEVWLDCIVDSVKEHLASRAKQSSDFDRFLIAAPVADQVERLAAALAIQPEKIVVPVATPGSDPFTSGLAVAWSNMVDKPCRNEPCQNELGRNQAGSDERSRHGGESWLLVSAGAGIEVGCAEYHFGPEESAP